MELLEQQCLLHIFYCLFHVWLFYLIWQCEHTFPMPVKPWNWTELKTYYNYTANQMKCAGVKWGECYFRAHFQFSENEVRRRERSVASTLGYPPWEFNSGVMDFTVRSVLIAFQLSLIDLSIVQTIYLEYIYWWTLYTITPM